MQGVQPSQGLSRDELPPSSLLVDTPTGVPAGNVKNNTATTKNHHENSTLCCRMVADGGRAIPRARKVSRLNEAAALKRSYT